MFPIHAMAYPDMDYYWRKFRCLDDEVEIFGDFNSAKGQEFVIAFEKCDNTTRTTCKSDQEIKEYLGDKYIATLHNGKRLDYEEFSDMSKYVVEESRLIWNIIDTSRR